MRRNDVVIGNGINAVACRAVGLRAKRAAHLRDRARIRPLNAGERPLNVIAVVGGRAGMTCDPPQEASTTAKSDGFFPPRRPVCAKVLIERQRIAAVTDHTAETSEWDARD